MIRTVRTGFFKGFSFIILCVLLLFPEWASGDSMLYLGMWDDTGSATLLGQYDGTLGLTQVQTPFVPFAFLAVSQAGVLYGVDGANLYTVDKVTGTATLAATLHCGSDNIECSGLTFKPDGTMLVHEYSNRTGNWVHKLYSGVPATGALTYIADITGLTTGLYGIEYANGTLFGVYDQALYSINLTTGAATLIGNGTSAWDLAYGEDNVMRGSGPDGGVYSINLGSGAATLLRNFRSTDNKDPWGIGLAGPDQFTLHLSASAGGTVTTPGVGDFPYPWGTVVSVLAEAETGYSFVTWTGTAVTAGKVADPNSPGTTVTMNDEYTLQANFGSTSSTPPSITGQPASRMALVGTSASFTVTAAGTAPLSYRWQKQNDSNGWENISGPEAASDTYTINPVAGSDAGGYRCVVSNAAGSATTNRVTRNGGDANRDGKVNVSDLGILSTNYGQTAKSWVTADFNGDGAVNVSDLGILATNYGFGN